ncbi:DNA-3-methyladenine glycosylase I [Andreprevotia lacus DSM 23236]|jgi:DNA-3-methyladenine glycosylase I|uniref:DNA-3-methyladenine glycosylase I n=1 Tax=Andreprevotia lacus DSM 23236 TaxID=1121001 RepID=A0A1W1XN83_9NEIS|nr:DNA-3-methyladenine glycosylase I [Andreprevotia lacus]SMC25439.1 DNA-3-methyladenine glycosylase I [Andreprevotia lacus DSM 23236]
MNSTYTDPDGLPRCHWCSATDQYISYHDLEWGYPVADDVRLFEKICLEGFQSGLSWRTILAKRDNFRAAFDGFDFHRIATYTDADISRLLANAGIVRHRGKIEAVINNANRALALVQEAGSLAAFFWRYEARPETQVEPQTVSTTELSHTLSKALKKRGWKFVGPTTVYAFMQAMGLVNDHATDCAFRQKVADARVGFMRPGDEGKTP